MKNDTNNYVEGVKLKNFCLSLNPLAVTLFDVLLKEYGLNRSEGVRWLMDHAINKKGKELYEINKDGN